MSDQNFVYGVFAENEKALAVIEKLHKGGFNTAQLGVLGSKSKEFKYISGRVEDPAARNFILWGSIGCIAGLIAGIAGSPHIANLPFQILTPLMAAISGGVVLAYFGSFMAVYLHSDKPQHWANVFEGTIEAGSLIVLAECSSRSQMRDAMEIIDSEEPLELIARQKSLTEFIRIDSSYQNAAVELAIPTLSAVA